MGSNNAISTSKIINKIEIKKNRYENLNRVAIPGLNPHSYELILSISKKLL